MEQDFDIEIQDSHDESKVHVQLPMNFLAFGEIEPDDVKVYIKQDVYRALEKYALADVEHERGTILLGDYCEELGKIHVIISNYIEARYTDASASTLTFTHETWNYVYKEQEAKYPDKKIVGWQHTHPSYGIFLSNYDLFIQENFFNLPFQVAYVIDPVQNIRGFFQWKNNKTEKLKGYYIYDDVGKSIKIEQEKRKKESAHPIKLNSVAFALLVALCFSTGILSFFAFSLNQKYIQQLKKQESIIEELVAQSEIIDDQSNKIATLQGQIVNSILDSSGQTTAANLIEMLKNREITLQNQEEVLNELQAFVEREQTKPAEIRFVAYTVVKGDNLEKICEAQRIDYDANVQIILSVNGIENANLIYAGQIIMLPISS